MTERAHITLEPIELSREQRIRAIAIDLACKAVPDGDSDVKLKVAKKFEKFIAGPVVKDGAGA